MQEDNQIVEGRFWDSTTQESEVSIEQDFAQELGLSVGDEVAFDIAGESISARVTSLRSVEWDSFSPNFFVVFTPSVLESFPATFITSLYADESERGELLDLMRAFPSVTVIDLDAMLGQVRDVMDKAALAVQAVFI
ncbi:MAG: permease, partial [Xanthomonadales bacterium]